MKQLSENWLVEGLLDAEYKKYILLDYLQFVEHNYERKRLFPFLSDVVAHRERLTFFAKNKQQLLSAFPKRLKAIKWVPPSMVFEKTSQDSVFEELDSIIEFSLQEFDKNAKKGKAVFDELEKGMVFEPIGLVPIQKQEGYLLLTSNNAQEVLVYNFQIDRVLKNKTGYRTITTNFLQAFRKNMINTIEQIKMILIKQFQHLPNPATYLAQFPAWYPIKETLLPIAKRQLLAESMRN